MRPGSWEEYFGSRVTPSEATPMVDAVAQIKISETREESCPFDPFLF
jgi:hypothetical protein